jgi:hypothetical protein
MLCSAIADRVRVAQPLALHHFEKLEPGAGHSRDRMTTSTLHSWVATRLRPRLEARSRLDRASSRDRGRTFRRSADCLPRSTDG